MTLVIYRPLTEAEIKEDAVKAKTQIKEWFDKNPKRHLCKAMLWYGSVANIHKKSIDSDIDKAADKAMNHKKGNVA